MKLCYNNIIVCLLLFVYTIAGAQPKASLSQVSIKGNKFTTADGKVIVFRGLDTSDPDKLLNDGHWNKEYFEAMKSWGANIVRFPVHPNAWRKQGKEAYLKLLDQGVQWAGELGMYVIIDWHSIGNLRSDLYQNAMYETTKKETLEFWRTISNH
ncbi:MAG: cellulase family glycosylhydrolase, partial [Flavisolibacter sp.]|nr:cellulase family glycosylhydrolase [Flavisolibacter sp.]